jgi:endonuclease/exonuclease/phosphatase family metal-dependent hydrolase
VEASRSWNSACNRVASWVVLAQKGAEHIKSLVRQKKELLFVGLKSLVVQVTSCHLDHFSEVARVNSCRLIVQKANDLSQWFGCRTSFIVGDFNTSPGDEPQCYAPFLESSFRDACVEALERFEEKGTFHNFTGSSIGSRIDWLYVGGYAKSKRAIIYTQKKGKFYPSDHFPLYCEFSL